LHYKLFPTDMASFAINIKYLKSKAARFYHLSQGNYETLFLQELITVDQLEPKANNCSKAIFDSLFTLF
jgi:hypothetical protein